MLRVIKRFYEKHYKGLLVIPLLLLIFAIGQIYMQINSTGDFINKGVSLKGGITITIDYTGSGIHPININTLESQLRSEFPTVDVSIREQSELGEVTGILVDAAIEKDDAMHSFKSSLISKISGLTMEQIESNIAAMGSSLGQAFFRQTFRAVIIAFILMGIVVFFYFRVPIPSIAVILAALSDIVITVAIFNLTGLKLSTAGIAAFLMLIGYSVDTDILLSTRVLKFKEGTVFDRILQAMKTGLMMSITTIIALIVGLTFSISAELKQIMLILLIGLVVDLINTWIQNAGILRWYVEKKHKGASPNG